jgi:hypothetical protein
MRNTWQVVVLVCAALASVDVLALTHASALDLMSVIAATVVPTVSLMLIGHQLSGQVTDVQEKVNGRMSELIANQQNQTTNGGGTDGS